MLTLNQPLFESLTSAEDFKRFVAALDHFSIAYNITTTQPPNLNTASFPPPPQTPEHAQQFYAKNNMLFKWNFDRYMPPHMSIEAQNTDILFNRALELGVDILHRYGFQQYNVVYNQAKDQIILIPAANNDAEKIDISDKVSRTSFILWRQRAPQPYTGLASHKFADKRGSLLHFNRVADWDNKSQLMENLTAMLSAWLAHYQISSESTLLEVYRQRNFSQTLKSHTRSVPTCKFCEPKTIYNQLVLDAGSWLILINYRPTAGTKAHFLILPKYHIEDWYVLQAAEKNSLHKVITAISRSIQTNCQLSTNDIISYVQNGNQVGQTAPHTHMHVLNTPAFAPYLIDIYYQLFADRAPTLSNAQMRTIANIFGPLIYQELLIEMGPRPSLQEKYKLPRPC